jgi:MFS family permease
MQRGPGVLILPGSIVMVVCGPLSGAIGNRVGNKTPLVAGSAVATIGLFALAFAHGTIGEVIAFSTLMAAGVGLWFAAQRPVLLRSPPRESSDTHGWHRILRRRA